MRALAALLLLVPLAAAAQVPAPEVKVGDRWVYRHSDARFQPPVFNYELRVTFVDARAIHTLLVRQGTLKESDATWTPQWASVVSVDEGVVETEKPMLQFPLAIGGQYPAAWDNRRPRIGNFHARHERTVRVVGWEEIEVPAGRFRALKLEAQGNWRRMDRPASGRARNTIWYVPEVKRWVKSVYEDANSTVSDELYFYVVQ
jgi:hypothetical protein